MKTTLKSAKALKALRKHLPEKALVLDEWERYVASMDSARFSVLPEAVIRPTTTEELQKVLVVANRYSVPLTVRGAGSATTAATTPLHEGWVVDLNAWNRIRIDDVSGMAHVGAGAVTAKINAAAEKKGWFYPPDPSSKDYCTIGGNIATNAGGLRGAKYGVTRDYVLALEGFLPTGEPVRWGMPLRKFAAGYNMRDLWVGSEGTLGVITGAVLKLLPKPEARWTCLLAFASEAKAMKAVKALLKARITPSILEFLDRQTVICTRRFTGKAMFAEHPEVPLLLLELDGLEETVSRGVKGVLAWASEHALAWRETRDPEVAESLWSVRRQCSQAMFQMGDTKLNEDIVVPVRSYEALLRFTLQLKKITGLATPTFGHVADGNFHVHLMYNHQDAAQVKQAIRGVGLLMEKVVEIGGAITGEHGIGLAKSPFVHLQLGKVELETMLKIKNTLDPNNILNPGKLFKPFPLWDHPADRERRFPWQKH